MKLKVKRTRLTFDCPKCGTLCIRELKKMSFAPGNNEVVAEEYCKHCETVMLVGAPMDQAHRPDEKKLPPYSDAKGWETTEKAARKMKPAKQPAPATKKAKAPAPIKRHRIVNPQTKDDNTPVKVS